MAKNQTVFIDKPIAINTDVSNLQQSTLTLDILNNDLNIIDINQLLLGLPSAVSKNLGSQLITNDNKISYQIPRGEYLDDDTFAYAIANNISESSTAAVRVSIMCANCVNKTISRACNQNQFMDSVSGYKI